MKILLGIGNALRGDDGVGPYIARTFQHPSWKSIDCGTAPENFTSLVRRERPEQLILVDAADMNLCPGEYRIVPIQCIVDLSFSTHSPSLQLLVKYLTSLLPNVVLVGIQPGRITDDEKITLDVEKGAEDLKRKLATDAFTQIPLYSCTKEERLSERVPNTDEE
jgi:hydrogenase 3 maturation protease